MQAKSQTAGGASIRKILSYVKKRSPAQTVPRGQAAISERRAQTSRQDFSWSPVMHPSRDWSRVLIQKLVPIIPSARFVAGIANKRLDLLSIQSERCPGAAYHIFFHHHGAEIVRSVFKRHLADAGSLRHPRALDIVDVIQKNPGQRLRP